MTNLTSVKDRMLYYIADKGISITFFYKDSGVTYGVLTQKSKISEDNIVRFLTRYDNVDANWLLTGKGSMLKESVFGLQDTASQSKEYKEETTSEFINKICELSAENALLKKENEELRELHKKRSGDTIVPIAAESKIEYGKK